MNYSLLANRFVVLSKPLCSQTLIPCSTALNECSTSCALTTSRSRLTAENLLRIGRRVGISELRSYRLDTQTVIQMDGYKLQLIQTTFLDSPEVLRGISFEVQSGERVGIGPSFI